VEDPEGRIWISTRSNGIISYDPAKDTLRYYVNGTSSARGLSSNQIIASMVDTRGYIWFGTMEGGANIYNPQKDSFEVLTSVHGLPNNTVYGILEDDNQFIWLSSNSGITRYDPGTGDMKNYSLEDGLSQMQFNYGSYFKDEEHGTLYFGSIGGLTYFDPEHIRGNQVPPSVIFTDFKLFNNSVRIGEKGLLSNHINYSDHIQLKYKQNVFSVDFVAINYASPGNNRFYYYLEGFESDWNDAGNRTSVTYTNLSPGAYTFHVRAKNNDGVESPGARSLQIRVLRPWWFSTLAMIIYGILMVTVILVSRRAIIIREKERSALSIEKMEKEKMRQMNQQRINFFTFISHEFKSPLSIIVASIEELSKTTNFNEEISKYFDRVRKSAKRLSFLIGQLMDFRKIETKHAQLALQKGDVIQFLRDTCLAFAPIFTRQEIMFRFSCNRESFVCWFDADKLEKIVTNLISNAIKYTPVDGTITCTTDILEPAAQENGSEMLEICISDTGKGMDAVELEWAFDPFHMDSEREARHSGTGVGLTLVKSLVEYLGGEIQASSDPGKGTSFKVTMPTDLSRASNIRLDNTRIHESREIDLDHISYQADIQQPAEKDEHDHGHYYIMIVEDKLELAEVLINHFSKHYRVSYAKNGLEAMKLVKQDEPDLIITDIVMPGMGGLELCKKIKSAEDTSHIAVILLTGKVSPEDRMEGLKAGAEAYISKPFDFNELDLHVKHFLEIRDNLRKKLIVEHTLDLKDVNIHDRDKAFIENVTRIIKENIGNECFSVEDMAGQLGMSRTLVYLKHKKLLNMSTKEYLQLIRFQKAIELMKATDENISQIAYTVGFSDPNYFSRAFKKIYKVSPTEYKENLLKKSGAAISKDLS
jgi:signal transduction histidine kinase/CheY-like chemotaxis protein